MPAPPCNRWSRRSPAPPFFGCHIESRPRQPAGLTVVLRRPGGTSLRSRNPAILKEASSVWLDLAPTHSIVFLEVLARRTCILSGKSALKDAAPLDAWDRQTGCASRRLGTQTRRNLESVDAPTRAARLQLPGMPSDRTGCHSEDGRQYEPSSRASKSEHVS